MSERSIRVRLTKTLGPEQYPERGRFTVPLEEARQMVRGVVIQLAQEQVEDTHRTATEAEVFEKSTEVLNDVESELARRYSGE